LDNNTKKPWGLFKVLTIVLCILLVASIILCIVLNNAKNHMSDQVSVLTETNASLFAERDSINDMAQTAQEDLDAAGQTIDRLTEEATDADNTIASLQTDLSALQAEYSAYQTDAEANLAAAVQQGKDNVQAERDAAAQTIAALQAELDALQAEINDLQAAFDAYQIEADTALAAAIQQGEDNARAAHNTANETIASLQTDLDALQAAFDEYQVEAEADLAAAIQQGKDNVQAVQDAANETIASLQAELNALQSEPDARLAEDEPAAVEEAPAAVQETDTPFAKDAVVATVNGEDVTGDDVLASYVHVVGIYGEPDEANEEIYYAIAMESAITLKLIRLTGAEMDLDQFTQEELDDLYAASDSEWSAALDNYVSGIVTDPESLSEADAEAAYAEAKDFYASLGYSQESLRQSYLDNAVYERMKEELCKDITVSDDEVLAYIDGIVQGDREIYESDTEAYETQLMMYLYGYADREPWYHPEGYRHVKNLLLSPDEALLASYLDLLARYEAQAVTEDAAEPAAENAEAAVMTEETVTAEDVEAAKAAVIASVQAQLDEINANLAVGVSFDDLMAEYGTDPGMTSGEYPDGYEVSLLSNNFVPEFISAAFSVDDIGEISQPYISDYGVHLVQYTGDVPGGPIELTDELKAETYEKLLGEKCAAALNAWHDSADIVFTGVIPSIDEIQAE
jgi:predicted  nucleic acid-binding Zn-ribbon protein